MTRPLQSSFDAAGAHPGRNKGATLIHLERVALEIKNVGLYDLILQDVQQAAGKKKLSEDEIVEIIQTHPEILEAYKQLNVEYNISNIHIRDIDTDKLDDRCKENAKAVNVNLARLREIEKYTLDFEQSATLVIIFSVEFFVLFSVQYFIVLLDLKAWQWWIYGMFALSIAAAYWYAKREQKKFAYFSAEYEALYEKTLSMIEELEENGCIKRADLIIQECEEHV